MALTLLPDTVWDAIEPILPKHPPDPRGGRPRIADRSCLIGILFVLRTGAAWNQIPKEMNVGSGPTCWRRFREWTEAGVWKQLHEKLLSVLGSAEEIDWSRAVIDSASVRAVFGGPIPDRTRLTEGNRAANAM